MLITRRSLLRSLLAAPFVVATPGLLMPVRAIEPEPIEVLKLRGWDLRSGWEPRPVYWHASFTIRTNPVTGALTILQDGKQVTSAQLFWNYDNATH